jgi:flagellar motor switch protein FliM
VLAETTITLQDLMSISVGDMIVTDKPASAPAVLCVEGSKKFLAHLGQVKGERALRIIRAVTPRDRT